MMKDRTITSTHRLRAKVHIAVLAFIAGILGVAAGGCGVTGSAREGSEPAATARASAADDPTSPAVVAEGQRVFRFETFGDERVWTDTLHLNEVVEKNVDPTSALKVGLKVDADALPAGILEKVDLASPTTTVALLKNGAYAARTANKGYRTTPLRALRQHAPYFHDGTPTLADVLRHLGKGAVRRFRFTVPREQQERPGKTFLGGVEQLVDEVFFDADVPGQHVRQEAIGERWGVE
jgi:hypothetical protein